MIPLLPFAAGLVAGAAAVSALRSERAKIVLDATGTHLRGAAASAETQVRAAAKSGLALLHRKSATADTPPAKPKRATKKPATSEPASAAKHAPRKVKPAAEA
ncbi:hypothetical protein MASR1M60_26180 [Rhodocyclaceae bacterium]